MPTRSNLGETSGFLTFFGLAVWGLGFLGAFFGLPLFSLLPCKDAALGFRVVSWALFFGLLVRVQGLGKP